MIPKKRNNSNIDCEIIAGGLFFFAMDILANKGRMTMSIAKGVNNFIEKRNEDLERRRVVDVMGDTMGYWPPGMGP